MGVMGEIPGRPNRVLFLIDLAEIEALHQVIGDGATFENGYKDFVRVLEAESAATGKAHEAPELGTEQGGGRGRLLGRQNVRLRAVGNRHQERDCPAENPKAYEGSNPDPLPPGKDDQDVEKGNSGFNNFLFLRIDGTDACG